GERRCSASLGLRQVRPQATRTAAAPPSGSCSSSLSRMTRQLWAPWRLEYIQQADEQEGCVFCRAAAGGDDEGLVVGRGARAFAMLNKLPYSSGHLMVAPYRHVSDLAQPADVEAQ